MHLRSPMAHTHSVFPFPCYIFWVLLLLLRRLSLALSFPTVCLLLFLLCVCCFLSEARARRVLLLLKTASTFPSIGHKRGSIERRKFGGWTAKLGFGQFSRYDDFVFLFFSVGLARSRFMNRPRNGIGSCSLGGDGTEARRGDLCLQA